ncbi:MAG: DUF896 domain-containing protein [Pirellula sp.]|nr:DUF896 domain-containing protein [Pirellula sp.]
MIQPSPTTSATILARALMANPREMSPELAAYIDSIELDPEDLKRVNELAIKVRAGLLTAEEEHELDEYRRIGRIIETLKLRAKTILNS